VRTLRYFAALPFLVACGGGGQTGAPPPAPDMANPAIVGQHGTVVDYFSSTPLAGFTVTDGNNTTTTDAAGYFLLPAPMGVKLNPTVTGPSYSTLYLPEATAAAADVDRGDIPIPSTSSFALAQNVLASDSTKAIVYVTLVRTGSCTSLAGGTLTVLSPAGTSVAYFTPQGLPTGKAFIDRTGNLPVALVFNVPPGEDVTIALNHPTCTLAPADTNVNGAVFTGHVTTAAAEPGDHNSSLTLAVE
jgi:hypothetical protein